jgi:rhodanese-related sulfurtransferase
MLSFLKKLLSSTPAVDYKQLLQEGAVIVDVRTREEYRTRHIKNSLNIPLNELTTQLPKLNKNKPIITCCASGMRSANARSTLLSNGFTTVYNAGSWVTLKKTEE